MFRNVSSSSTLRYRKDIDGLRGVAIIMVVAFHAFPNLFSNGYLGVDIFFVISGYLITGIILKQKISNQFSLATFFNRRIRRLLPAAAVVLFFVTFVANLTFFDNEWRAYQKALRAAVGYYTNYQLLAEVGYFDSAVNFKSLMHFWSLNVEEQFYILWPMYLLLILGFFKKNYRIFLTSINFILISISLYYFFSIEQNVYFSLLARIWQLALGGQLAIFMDNPKNNEFEKNVKLSYFVCVFGILLVLGGQFIEIQQTASLVAVFGALLLLMVASNLNLKKIYDNPIFVGFGKISYSLYLWHWPILSISRTLFGNNLKPETLLVEVSLSILLSVLSYLFIEQVFLKIQWSGKKSSALLGLYGFVFLYSPNIPRLASYNYSSSRTDLQVDNEPHVQLCPINNLRAAWCYAAKKNTPAVFKGLIIGDSHAHSQYPGLNSVFPDVQWLLLSDHGCSPFIVAKLSESICQNDFEKAIRLLEKDSKFKWLAFSTANRVFNLEKEKIISNSNFSKLVSLLNRLDKEGKKVIVFEPVPEISDNVAACILKRPDFVQRFIENNNNCDVSLLSWQKATIDEKEFLNKLSIAAPHVVMINPESVICDSNLCSVKQDEKSLYVDRDHLSPFGSLKVAELLKKTLAGQ